ncbi:hypothetical protein HanRHA438_Chr11g0498051 [Helianthus annuus]|uniref:Uncharacterized protein n=1 Tax=Helianthus annuus TaxID=4232 RepID=A0A9K3MZN3_HELAN|nr:hypothetical protein HanXRQr2_Chr11g0485551 [Helianthus annuus]KAJ0501169.1 hypothetical protein HanHA300_Chr11g0397681 [Helianthus annuus]KAJ0508883.1 hypothetical protein HanIR_Chr11g0522341 [Helianthus annuus]KAJ0517063.1 hypothetical protein HanHA89_Chr11g0420971 [Helianthus annuus]KAJ0685072.1 hypothetical protein HanLR1_Chr11g0398391 [Helianthus annuus]
MRERLEVREKRERHRFYGDLLTGGGAPTMVVACGGATQRNGKKEKNERDRRTRRGAGDAGGGRRLGPAVLVSVRWIRLVRRISDDAEDVQFWV